MVALPRGPFNVILTRAMAYQIGHTRDTIMVPRGFVTDFASIPRPLWAMLSPVGDYKLAAIVHDYLYWFQPCTRAQSDNILAIAMKEQGVPDGTRRVVYRGVRAGGQSAWNANARERQRGIPRVVPDSLAHPEALDSWETMRTRLMTGGLRGDTLRLSKQRYCRYGDSQNVP
jgi:hypothetical protein